MSYHPSHTQNMVLSRHHCEAALSEHSNRPTYQYIYEYKPLTSGTHLTMLFNWLIRYQHVSPSNLMVYTSVPKSYSAGRRNKSCNLVTRYTTRGRWLDLGV